MLVTAMRPTRIGHDEGRWSGELSYGTGRVNSPALGRNSKARNTMTASIGKATSPTAESNIASGIAAAIFALTLFGMQDALTKFLVADYPVSQFLLVRFGVFALFSVAYVIRRPGLRTALRSRRPVVQALRAILLVADIVLFCIALRYLGLADFHAIYATTPLMVTLLVGPLLGEKVGWRRYSAVTVGFIGAMVIIRPGSGVFNWAAIVVLASGFCFALYSIATRLVSRDNSVETSTLYTACVSALLLAPAGVYQWRPLDTRGALMMAAISATGLLGHLLYIRALSLAPAVVLQPFTYLLLVWAAFYGIVLFGQFPDTWTILGAAIVVSSGLYVTWREWIRGTSAKPIA
jgi:drug/metabolite transporter (DMT)-like permease